MGKSKGCHKNLSEALWGRGAQRREKLKINDSLGQPWFTGENYGVGKKKKKINLTFSLFGLRYQQ